MKSVRWAQWRTLYTLRSPYFRPHRILAARKGHGRRPDFLIIGVERGGTTSLYSYLSEDPRIAGALRKEINFFDRNYSKGWTWYTSHFPLKTPKLTGEASPNYVFFPEAAQRIGEFLPDTKLILLLRNPITRAYSHYQHEVALGYERLSFEDAIRRECNVDPNDAIIGLRNLREKGIFDYVHYSYVGKGLYADQLKQWITEIPRQRFLILKSESLFREPRDILTQVEKFLGLNSSKKSTFKKYNEGQYTPMKAATRLRLQQFYSPHEEQLRSLLTMDLSDWE